MKKILYIIIPVVLIGAVIFKLQGNKKMAQNKIYYYNKEQPVNVQADTLKLQSITAEQYFTGTFEPEKEVKLSAETQGKINSIFVDIGSYAKKGQTLIKMDNALLKLQLQAVSVQIEGLEADVNRYTILANADAIQGVQLEKAQLGLKSAKVQRNTILEQIAKTNVTAPFSGIVTMRFSEIGAFAAPGTPLLQITDISRLRFTVSIPENDLHLFHLNQNYSLKADAYDELMLSGKTILIGSKGNAANSFQVQFSINNTPDLKIKSGMFGKVLISEMHKKDALLIPSSAIVGSDIEPKAYVVKNNKAVLQNISINQRLQKGVVIKDGLNAGDIIITGGFINLYDGAAISIKN
ncbi:efflux RND transporter periplasmic adaptor subunit [Agriterribacter sp.]|uniref:efflux RND transporter periplasmic adaptor subunit n=1 Tax=Agriterribacter sp. TaxID=2821509 RepID=UPI002B956A8F|nr:efflux RND transporter periplasmic adaptor subunit [Agriterribacter sp.]HTN09251.1 efflux RND transporter periplasmic adaptor subunit [Agriterribacter sp.]